MKAVKYSDFDKYGCVNCGCDYCYCDYYRGPATMVICAECHEKFFVMTDSMKISNVGMEKETYDGFVIPEQFTKNGVTVVDFLSQIPFTETGEIEKMKNGFALEKDGFVWPIVGHHPREGILKHSLVLPDIRPEDGKGDFCTPRGVGYDLACFVKSKEAGERITNMINLVNKDYQEKGFSCRLDYREEEPLWIQVKITYPNELRARYLEELIQSHDNIITEEFVRQAMNLNLVDLLHYYEEKKKIKKTLKIKH